MPNACSCPPVSQRQVPVRRHLVKQARRGRVSAGKFSMSEEHVKGLLHHRFDRVKFTRPVDRGPVLICGPASQVAREWALTSAFKKRPAPCALSEAPSPMKSRCSTMLTWFPGSYVTLSHRDHFRKPRASPRMNKYEAKATASTANERAYLKRRWLKNDQAAQISLYKRNKSMLNVSLHIIIHGPHKEPKQVLVDWHKVVCKLFIYQRHNTPLISMSLTRNTRRRKQEEIPRAIVTGRFERQKLTDVILNNPSSFALRSATVADLAKPWAHARDDLSAGRVWTCPLTSSEQHNK